MITIILLVLIATMIIRVASQPAQSLRPEEPSLVAYNELMLELDLVEKPAQPTQPTQPGQAVIPGFNGKYVIDDYGVYSYKSNRYLKGRRSNGYRRNDNNVYFSLSHNGESHTYTYNSLYHLAFNGCTIYSGDGGLVFGGRVKRLGSDGAKHRVKRNETAIGIVSIAAFFGLG